MPAKLYQFPLKTFKGLKIPLYTEEEIEITLMCLNCFGGYSIRITESNIEELDPLDIMKCLYEAKSSEYFSTKAKQLINNILKSIEAI
jgi:hypothetical protein